MRQLVYFAHGNGFPALCYRQLLTCLSHRFDYCYIDKVGHDEIYPVTENWNYLVQEVIKSIQVQATMPVIAIGHSLGGVLSFLAAIEQPELFKAVILLDSPIIGRFKSQIIRLSKHFGLIDKITPAEKMRYRRKNFKDKTEAWHYLKGRGIFSTFSDTCLQDYIDYGLDKSQNGLALRFNREIEYEIYRTVPHRLQMYEGQLKVPAALVYGRSSKVLDTLDLRYMKKAYDFKCYEIQGGHMFPMENPEDSAELIFKVIDSLL